MKCGTLIAFTVAALFAAGDVAACSMTGPQQLTPEQVAKQGEEWARADSVYIALGRFEGVSPCGSVFVPVPAIALKNSLPTGPVTTESGMAWSYSGDHKDDDRIVVFARRVRLSEDWRRWGQWQRIATYRMYELRHLDATRALTAVLPQSYSAPRKLKISVK